jgi:hypothetical protein
MIVIFSAVSLIKQRGKNNRKKSMSINKRRKSGKNQRVK